LKDVLSNKGTPVTDFPHIGGAIRVN